LQGLPLPFQHSAQEVHRAVARRLLADLTAAVGNALAGEGSPLRPAGQALVGPVEVADLPVPHADVPGGHVGVRPHIAVQSGHEALAEAHDLPAAAAPWVEVRPAGGAA